MFIRKHTNGGYTRGGEQRSGRGDYLALFSWNDSKAEDEIRASCADCCALVAVYDAAMAKWRDPELPADQIASIQAIMHAGKPRGCVQHTYDAFRAARDAAGDHHKYPNGQPMLWAVVRSCSLRQFGHFMMGSIRIGDCTLSVSGSIGSDGLPMDYQKVPPAYRHLLIQVPEDIAAVYWKDDGHNTIGRAAPDVRAWATSIKWK